MGIMDTEEGTSVEENLLTIQEPLVATFSCVDLRVGRSLRARRVAS
jgi:hypothetical protein